MYESFFEMTKTPFTRGIPVDMLYSNNDNEEIYNRLVYAAKKQLFAILIGDAGAGKTTTLRHLYEKLDGPSYAVLYLADSDLTPRHFYNGLLEQLGCETKFYRGDARKCIWRVLPITKKYPNDLNAASRRHFSLQ